MTTRKERRAEIESELMPIPPNAQRNIISKFQDFVRKESAIGEIEKLRAMKDVSQGFTGEEIYQKEQEVKDNYQKKVDGKYFSGFEEIANYDVDFSKFD